jgi:hypothetical protein
MRALRDAIVAGAELQPMSPPAAERPISFNDEMMRALLAGRKTQTRRLVAPVPRRSRRTADGTVKLFDVGGKRIRCRYGGTGDRLWVRERWAVDGSTYAHAANEDAPHGSKVAWRPSFHMPRCACRVLLDVLEVRAERLMQILRHDARLEGFAGVRTADPLAWFCDLWDRINSAPGTIWRENPWVWVIEFRSASRSASGARRSLGRAKSEPSAYTSTGSAPAPTASSTIDW